MEYITGLVCRKGRELGVPTPVNDAVIDLYRRIDSGELAMDPSNYDRLRARLPNIDPAVDRRAPDIA
jgi:hypothetical protein